MYFDIVLVYSTKGRKRPPPRPTTRQQQRRRGGDKSCSSSSQPCKRLMRLLLAANNQPTRGNEIIKSYLKTGFKQQPICAPLAPTRNKIIYKTAYSDRPNSGSGKASQTGFAQKGLPSIAKLMTAEIKTDHTRLHKPILSSPKSASKFLMKGKVCLGCARYDG